MGAESFCFQHIQDANIIISGVIILGKIRLKVEGGLRKISCEDLLFVVRGGILGDNLHGAIMEVGLRTNIEFVGSEDIPSTARLKIKFREIAGDLKFDTHNARAMTPTVMICADRQ